MAFLLEMCHEVLHDILAEVNPKDLGALLQSCRALHSYIKDNRMLWKDVYLRFCDDPRRETDQNEPDWEKELKQLVEFESVLKSTDVELRENYTEFICKTAIKLVEQAPSDIATSLNIDLLTNYLHMIDENAATFVLNSNIFELAKAKPKPKSAETSRLIAHLHCLYGTFKDDLSPPGRRQKKIMPHAVARSRIYDLRSYTTLTRWGPWMPDGSMRVDWEKVESIMLVIAHGINIISNQPDSKISSIWDIPFDGVTRESYVSQECFLSESDLDIPDEEDNALELVAQPNLPLDAMDPYGITGTWRRVICYLGYQDFYEFNFAYSLPLHTPRPPVNTREAIRVIVMKVQVTEIAAPGKEDGDALPVVHFAGTSRSLHAQWDPNGRLLLKGNQ